jgi:uncharacterized protein (TIGR00369 family)
MSMPDLEVDTAMVQRIMRDGIPHCRELGVEVVDVDRGAGSATMALDYDKRLVGDPETGILHGGAITTLIDTVCGMAVMASLKKLTSIATLDLRIDYLKPATPERRLFATAEVYKTTRHVAFAKASAYHDPEDPIASCVGTFMIGSSDTPPLTETGLKKEGGEA